MVSHQRPSGHWSQPWLHLLQKLFVIMFTRCLDDVYRMSQLSRKSIGLKEIKEEGAEAQKGIRKERERKS